MKKKLKTGLHVRFSEAPKAWNNKRQQIELERAYKSFKSEGGIVTVSNKYVTVILHEDGKVEIKPHEQLMVEDE